MMRMCELGLHGAVEDQAAGWKVWFFFFTTEAWKYEDEMWTAYAAWVDDFIKFHVCNQYVYYYVTS